MNRKLQDLLRIVEEIAKHNNLTCEDTEKLCKADKCKRLKLCMMIRQFRIELEPLPDCTKRENIVSGVALEEIPLGSPVCLDHKTGATVRNAKGRGMEDFEMLLYSINDLKIRKGIILARELFEKLLAEKDAEITNLHGLKESFANSLSDAIKKIVEKDTRIKDRERDYIKLHEKHCSELVEKNNRIRELEHKIKMILDNNLAGQDLINNCK